MVLVWSVWGKVWLGKVGFRGQVWSGWVWWGLVGLAGSVWVLLGLVVSGNVR